MAALITEVKPRQLQVTRIRQEEEESWISSEELHTDGSSDDEMGRWGGKHTHPHHHLLHHIPHPLPHRLPTSSPLASSGPLASPHPPSTASEPASQDSPHLTETTRRLSELGVEESPLLQGAPPDSPSTQEDCVEEQEDIMLWRPKRGSLKLTELASGAITLSSSCSSAGKLLKDPASSTTDIAEEKLSSATAAPGPSSGVISKCSASIPAKSPAPQSLASLAKPERSPYVAGQTTSSSTSAKGEDKSSASGAGAKSSENICSTTPRASTVVAVTAQNAAADLKNKTVAAKNVVVDAKVHESGT